MIRLLAAAVLAVAPAVPQPQTYGCEKTFTVHMDTRAARAIYRGTRDVTRRQLRLLRRLVRCQRHRGARAFVEAFNARSREAWARRRQVAAQPPPPPLAYAVASWYDTPGVGACALGPDVQSGYRFASLILACGAAILVCHAGCVVATMADHGPYVAGRTFDLNVNVRDAIACGGVCLVRWRLL